MQVPGSPLLFSERSTLKKGITVSKLLIVICLCYIDSPFDSAQMSKFKINISVDLRTDTAKCQGFCRQHRQAYDNRCFL